MEEWFVYLIEMADGSYYCGVAKDVAARIKAHQSGQGAKYTASRLPVMKVLAVSVPLNSRSAAQHLESAVKAKQRDYKVKFLSEWRSSGD